MNKKYRDELSPLLGVCALNHMSPTELSGHEGSRL